MKKTVNILTAAAAIWLWLAATPHLHARQEVANDSTMLSDTLREVIVRAPEAIQAGNRQIYYPTKELKETMATSSLLLAGLQIAGLIVNPADGSISIAGGGRLSVRINGRPASQTDLLTISAKDIIKVEYTSDPGVRYGDASGVVNLTVRRRKEGYGVVMNLLQSPNRGWGDYTVALRYNSGRSEWSADYHSNPMWDMGCYRDNTETIRLPEGRVITRRERGIETPNRMATHRAAVQYSYAVKSDLLLNVQARLTRRNDRYASVGTILTTEAGSQPVESMEKETAPLSSWQGDVDFYLHWKINRRHKVYLNIVPTIVSSTSGRSYENEGLSISSTIRNRAAMLLCEGVWEGRIGGGRLTGGVRGNIEQAKATYSPSRSTARNIAREGHAFAEWDHSVGKLRYIIGADASLLRMSKPLAGSFANITPRLFVRYTPVTRFGIDISVDGSTINPTAGQLSPVEERIDLFQYSAGSPELSPFRRYKTKVGLDLKISDATLRLAVTDTYCHTPVMSAKSYTDGKILQTYHNAGYNNDLAVKGEISTPILTKRLRLTLEGGWHRTVSKGESYRHTYGQGFVNAQLMFVTGPWWVMAKYNNAYNLLWGETVKCVNNNLLNLGAGYRYRAATFMAGMVNPIGNVSITSRDLSEIAGYERTYHAESTNCLAWIGVSLNISNGKRRTATRKKLDNNNIYETIKNVQK
ncbi:MAG: outer membrane beta-barrel protein [Staphylococcus sp.]|nr:outer membrane beta-barrel protein [Staphylococcus sp.]